MILIILKTFSIFIIFNYIKFKKKYELQLDKWVSFYTINFELT